MIRYAWCGWGFGPDISVLFCGFAWLNPIAVSTRRLWNVEFKQKQSFQDHQIRPWFQATENEFPRKHMDQMVVNILNETDCNVPLPPWPEFSLLRAENLLLEGCPRPPPPPLLRWSNRQSSSIQLSYKVIKYDLRLASKSAVTLLEKFTDHHTVWMRLRPLAQIPQVLVHGNMAVLQIQWTRCWISACRSWGDGSSNVYELRLAQRQDIKATGFSEQPWWITRVDLF